MATAWRAERPGRYPWPCPLKPASKSGPGACATACWITRSSTVGIPGRCFRANAGNTAMVMPSIPGAPLSAFTRLHAAARFSGARISPTMVRSRGAPCFPPWRRPDQPRLPASPAGPSVAGSIPSSLVRPFVGLGPPAILPCCPALRPVPPAAMASAGFPPPSGGGICLASPALRAACGRLCPLRSDSPGLPSPRRFVLHGDPSPRKTPASHPSASWPRMVVSSFPCPDIPTGDLHPVCNAPMLGTHNTSLLTPDPPPVPAAMTATASTPCSTRAPGQA